MAPPAAAQGSRIPLPAREAWLWGITADRAARPLGDCGLKNSKNPDRPLSGVEVRKGLPGSRGVGAPKTRHDLYLSATYFCVWIPVGASGQRLHSQGRGPPAQYPQHPELTMPFLPARSFYPDLLFLLDILREAFSGVPLFFPAALMQATSLLEKGWGVIAKENPPKREESSGGRRVTEFNLGVC